MIIVHGPDANDIHDSLAPGASIQKLVLIDLFYSENTISDLSSL